MQLIINLRATGANHTWYQQQIITHLPVVEDYYLLDGMMASYSMLLDR
jgi:hypothetical protein